LSRDFTVPKLIGFIMKLPGTDDRFWLGVTAGNWLHFVGLLELGSNILRLVETNLNLLMVDTRADREHS